MRLCRSWIVALTAAVSAPLAVQAATVYKWTDADGVVHFSDQPVPGAEKIVTASGASRGILGQPAPSAPKDGAKAPPSALASSRLTIASPGQDETFTNNQPVNVRLAAEPALKSSDTITWTLNGSPVSQPPDATEFALTDLARGTYTLAATVVDSASGESKSADPVTFTVVRPSVFSPQHK